MIRKEEAIRKMYQKIKDLKLEVLLAGLAVLVKDTTDFINTQGLKDDITEGLREAYLEMMNHDRYYWGKFDDGLYKELKDAGMPSGIIKEVLNCKYDLETLIKIDLKQGWPRAIGWYFFKTYTQQVKAAILDGRSVDRLKEIFCEALDAKDQKDTKDHKGHKDPVEPFVALVDRLSHRTQYSPVFLYPVMLYISVLLVATDFVTIDDN